MDEPKVRIERFSDDNLDYMEIEEEEKEEEQEEEKKE